ncbi:tetratricopeptide repeat protein [Nocardia sp. AG03]|uniref:tetratricopeptide repeat protein n=1 Tax=Nocardia sp. AG03 TaxID=3025312 RepID=UPI002418AFFF|nr:tetratricopeptide repeat protein [Nocardia sp. AG03]
MTDPEPIQNRTNIAKIPASAPSHSGVTAQGARSVAVGGNAQLIQTGDNATAHIVELSPEVLLAEVDTPRGIDNVPLRPGLFVGRDAELGQLDPDTPSGGYLVVHGIGGIGKSTLVAQWAATRAHKYSPAVWITASSAGEIRQGLADFAIRLQPILAAVLEIDQLAERGMQWLATHSQWLLVLDNAENLNDIGDVLARVGTGGRIIVTSRRSTGWQPGTALLPLEVLHPSESLRLLIGLMTSAGPRNEDGSVELCAELGHLPLAIEQSGAYLQQSPFATPRTYLQMLVDHPADTYAQTAVDGDSARTIARVWRVTLDRVTAIEPAAAELLRVLAWYGPDAVPYLLLQNLAHAPMLDNALGVLAAYSMITPDLTTRSISVHRLVQAVTRTADPTDPHREPAAIERARNRAMAALHTALPDHQDPASWQDWRALLPHIEILSDHTRSCPHESTVIAAALDLHAGIFLHGQGLNAPALDHLERALDIRERILGDDHPDTLTARDRVARSYRAAGRANEALVLLERTVAARERVLGARHADTLDSRHNLAYVYETIGRPHDAVELFERTLTYREQTLGRDHPDALSTRSSIARVYRTIGRVPDAITLFERALADSERILGRRHPNTLSTRSSLAHAYLETGRSNEAITLFEQVRRDCEHILGDQHPNTFSAANNLASAYASVGRLTEAVELFEQTFRNRESVLGTGHSETLEAGNNLARAYRDIGQTHQAIELFERTRTHCMNHLGFEHLTTLRVGNNLASTYQSADRIVDAVRLFEQNLRDRLQVLGPCHLMTLVSRFNLAVAYLAQKRVDEAIELLNRTFSDCEQALGRDDAITEKVARKLESARQNSSQRTEG